jgi:hypothetical protein
MIFASWTFDGFFLDINVNSNEGDITNYIKNGEWHLVRLLATKYLRNYSCCEEPYPEIYYKLIIRRRPLYYVFNMVFPCLLITLVAFLGFYLPPGSTEKVSIGITTLLSITVFLMLVAESMPPTSEQLPLLGIYYAVTIGIVSFSTSMAVITLNINNKGSNGKEVPKIVKIIYFDYLARYLNIKLSHRTKIRSFSIISSSGELFNKKLLNTHSFKKEKKLINVANSKKSNSNLKVYDMHSQITNKKTLNNSNTSNYVVESSLACKDKDKQINKTDTRKHSSDNETNLSEEENKKSKKLIERVNLEVEKSNYFIQKEESSLLDALENSSLFKSPQELTLPTSISNYDNLNLKKMYSSNFNDQIVNRNAQLYNIHPDKYDSVFFKQPTPAKSQVS